MDMNFGMRAENRALLDRVATMIRDEVMPMEAEYHAEIAKGDRWAYTERQAEILEGLKAKAKAEVNNGYFNIHRAEVCHW